MTCVKSYPQLESAGIPLENDASARETPKPVVVTYRTPGDRGHFLESDHKRQETPKPGRHIRACQHFNHRNEAMCTIKGRDWIAVASPRIT